MESKNLKHWLFFSVAALVLLFDQISKLLIKNNIGLNAKIAVINDFFYVTRVQNRGAGFGLLQNKVLFFIIFAVIIIGVIFYYYKKIPDEKYVIASVALIMGGILGNLIDRILFGYVIDFIGFSFWPTFNIADTAITIGVILLGIYIIRE